MRAGPGMPCRTEPRACRSASLTCSLPGRSASIARVCCTEPSRVSPRASPWIMRAKAPAASWAVACPWVWAAHSTASWRTSCGSQPTSSPNGPERVSAAESRAAGFLGTARVPIVASPKPTRHSRVGARRAYSHSSPASQPLSSRRSSGPQALWVAAHRRWARCTSVGGCQAPVSRRTWARMRPSTVKRVSWVTAVTAPRLPCAATKSVSPSAPWASRIASRPSPETPAPSASPMAPPSREPRTRLRKSCCWARPQTAVVPVLTVPLPSVRPPYGVRPRKHCNRTRWPNSGPERYVRIGSLPAGNAGFGGAWPRGPWAPTGSHGRYGPGSALRLRGRPCGPGGAAVSRTVRPGSRRRAAG